MAPDSTPTLIIGKRLRDRVINDEIRRSLIQILRTTSASCFRDTQFVRMSVIHKSELTGADTVCENRHSDKSDDGFLHVIRKDRKIR